MTQSDLATDREALQAIVQQGRALILEQQHPGGAYPASPTFSAYRGFSWFRDGAFIADAMSALGERDSAERFFDWCAATLERQAGRISAVIAEAAAGIETPADRMLPTRYTLDGAPGDVDWWDFQLDGYGTWLWALEEHVARHGGDPTRWRRAVELTADYLLVSWRRPCFDWWEEHDAEVHVSTLGCVAAGLRSASRLGVLDAGLARRCGDTADAATDLILEDGVADGRLRKWLGSNAVDGSLLALLAPLDVLDVTSAAATGTLTAVETELTVDGGVHRYAADVYYGGGQWPLLSCFLGLAHLARGDEARATELLRWAAGTATRSGTMPEQVADHLLHPDRLPEWETRWGRSADPLLWSYAMYIRLAVELRLTAGGETR
ncbi:glycoside hydrolase family 15 protein [Lysobacter korlensis]|uniref:Glycoside hydrolase family 15 protein n=1 Tax=Lysobacter korlensis TaxID=553636 RepID=A0ABV6RP63_9GAMM